MYAFKCSTCGNLQDAETAGDNRTIPLACTICNAGVTFDSVSGIKTAVPENWIVLADLSPADLQPILDDFKLEKKDIEKHIPTALPE